MNPAETGFYYLNSRYYDPEVGRFINADSYVFTGQGMLGYNMFAYCFNNPVNYSDLSGNFAKEIAFTAVAIGIGIVGVAVAIVDTAHKAGEAAAEVVKDVVREAVRTGGKEQETNTQNVYVLVDENEEVHYVGRTVNPEQRAYQHKNDPFHPERKNYDMVVVATGLTVDEARVAEQIVISTYVLASGRVNGKLQGLDNRIRGIAVGKIGNFTNCFEKMMELFGTVAEDEFLNLMGR